jgi:probable F420-dependent oxidoreductase
MDVGVHLPHLGQQATRANLLRFSQAADDAGYHSVWVSDHICWPSEYVSRYPYSADGRFPAPNDISWLDCIGTLLFVAAATERVRLGTTVLIVPYRPPVQTAKLLSTLDVVSEGRLILGIGVGWMREEFEVLDMPFDHRGARTDEQIEMWRRLFETPEPSFDGQYYDLPAVRFAPKPAQAHVPIWVGGATDAAWRRVARYGDAFHAAFEAPDAIAHAWSKVKEYVAEAGRDPGTVRCSLRWYLDPEGQREPSKGLQGSTSEIVDQIGRLADIGVDHLVLDPVASGGFDGRLAAVERFAADVMPQI